MKIIAAPLLAYLAGAAITRNYGLRITRTDGQVFAWTDRQVDTTVDDSLFRSAPGADLSALATSAGFATDNAEVRTVLDDLAITEADILAGRWEAARWELLLFVGKNLGLGFYREREGRLGTVSLPTGGYVLELRGDTSDLQVTVGAYTSPTCRWEYGGARCGIALGPLTVTGNFTASSNGWHATDSGRAEAEDFFTGAVLTITSGDNEGLRRKVVAFDAGEFTFGEAFPFPIGTAAYSVYSGCMQRFEEDCVGKHANGRRFGGEPHLPGQDKLQRRPEVSA